MQINPLVAINSPDGHYLEAFAIANYWSNPRVESNLVWKPSKLTNSLAQRNSIKYQGYTIDLPDRTSRWHILTMHANQIPRNFFTYDPNRLQYWNNLADLATDYNSQITFYDNSGRVYPNSLIHVRVLYTGLLVFAVYAESLGSFTLTAEDLKVHFYNNKSDVDIQVQGVHYKSATDLISWISQLRQYQAMKGYTTIYVNGMFRRDVSAADVKVGDYLEFQYDSSVLYTREMNVLELNSFTDDTDPEKELEYYLVMNWENDDNTNLNPSMLHYKNDLSIFVLPDEDKGGVRLRRGAGSSIKQLTFQDLAVEVEEVNHAIGQLRDLHNDDTTAPINTNILILTREDGQDQRWDGDMNRVSELYLLRDKGLIEQAMLGEIAYAPEWLAKNLIHNRYITMLECQFEYLDGLAIWDGLGYYACDNVINRMPILAKDFDVTEYTFSYTQSKAHVELAYNRESGKLLSITQLEERDKLYYDPVRNFYEIYLGEFVNTALTDFDHFNQDFIPLDEGIWWHFFFGPKDEFGKTVSWREIKPTDADFATYAKIENGNFVWLVDYDQYNTAVRRSDTILQIADGTETSIDKCVFRIPSELGFGEFFAAIGDTPLVYGVDYLVSWPYLAITSRKHLINQTVNDHVRPYIHTRGFPTSEGKFEFNGEVGFVKQGLLSVDNQYRLNGWRNYHLVVDGQIKAVEDVPWEEDQRQFRAGDSTVNGVPYEISYPFSYTLATLEEHLYMGSKVEDDEIDARVSAALDSHLPPVEFDSPSTFPEPYALYSPFVNAILQAMINGELTFKHSDIVKYGLDTLLEKYLYLKDLCPAINDTYIDMAICKIYPHPHKAPLFVTVDQLKILREINAFYLQNRVSITEAIRIKT